MVAAAITDRSLATFSKHQLLAGYNQLISIRDHVVTSGATAKPHNEFSNGVDFYTGAGPSTTTSVPASGLPNGVAKQAPVFDSAHAHMSRLNAPNNVFNPIPPKPPATQEPPLPPPKSSGIDPIFLTKSTVLVKAEIQQKRQRLENTLEEQVQRVQKQKALDHDGIPDFDVTDVLKQAQDLVKPIKSAEHNRTNGATSSSSSFDENTFYSSQMDESTTTEEVDESHKWRSHRICKFFLRGENCPYGGSCTFSHDPMLKQKLEADGSRATKPISVNIDEQASSRQDGHPQKRTRRDDPQSKPPTNDNPSGISVSQSDGERAMQEQIARLEAELASIKAQKQALPSNATLPQQKETNDSQEESAYSPPGPDEFGRDVGLREPKPREAASQRYVSPVGQLPAREYARRNGHPPSPLSSNVPVVTSHIKSPMAPQPSRVSPLAVAKVPQVSQLQLDHDENNRLSRMSNAENSSAGQSPVTATQPRGSRKRRRGHQSGEQQRNVVPRIEQDSPSIHVKEEPISPQPFNTTDSEVRFIRSREEPVRQMFVDTAANGHREEAALYQPREVERVPYGHLDHGKVPYTPIVRRVISRNGQRYIANDEPDLRRVVTAPRQIRGPMSPAPVTAQFSAPQPRTSRAASLVYSTPTNHGALPQYRASVQPQPPEYVVRERSSSPRAGFTVLSPRSRPSIAMAPPPRRIVVDQWGNRFIEAPVLSERYTSTTPLTRGNDADARYEEMIPRNLGAAGPPSSTRIENGNHFARREASPGVNSVATRRANELRPIAYPEEIRMMDSNGIRSDTYGDDRPGARYEEAFGQDTRIIRMQSVRPLERRYEDAPLSDERIIRMQSVRPAAMQYAQPPERPTRVQSVMPEQPRIINLGERPEPGRPLSRQMAGFPVNGEARQVGSTVEERPRYQYTPQVHNRGYVEDIHGGPDLYEAPGSGGRRVPQRI